MPLRIEPTGWNKQHTQVKLSNSTQKPEAEDGEAEVTPSATKPSRQPVINAHANQILKQTTDVKESVMSTSKDTEPIHEQIETLSTGKTSLMYSNDVTKPHQETPSQSKKYGIYNAFREHKHIS